jgi:hypothetical protein
MSMRDAIIGAAVGAVLGAAATVSFGVWHYYYVDKPTLETAQQAATNEEAARKRADERLRLQQEQLATLQKQSEEIKKQFELAKDQFISRLTTAVNEAISRLPKGEPNKQPPPITNDLMNRVIIPAARRIIDERDKARVGIRQVSGNLDKVYDELDSDIDDLKKVVDNPPTDPKTVQFLLQKISDKWPTKLKLIEELAVNSLQQMGCPMQLAATP